ncbi:hypothetical protein [Sinorhizobium medicae]|uniref:hypothetical protein n=1 Tax=Sinorhizobium medicae TaxID=110321 RepID=UPI000FDB638B|nr:hypothetical protein [Sinorhizobium medicae]RVO73880.1 hypothetical protein CN084_24035 [Sinorhizobium medicae]
MTQVVTISATTAAYAAEAAKPSTHMRGGGLVDEAITLLSAGRLERITMPSKIGSLLQQGEIAEMLDRIIQGS